MILPTFTLKRNEVRYTSRINLTQGYIASPSIQVTYIFGCIIECLLNQQIAEDSCCGCVVMRFETVVASADDIPWVVGTVVAVRQYCELSRGPYRALASWSWLCFSSDTQGSKCNNGSSSTYTMIP